MRILFIVLMLVCLPFAARAEGDVFKKVNDVGTLRCGYYVWPPYLIKDPNTGKMSGFYYDLVEELGKQLGLKIEWKEEVNWSNLFEGFDTGRVDAFCTPLFVLPSYAKATDFTINVGFEPIHLFVRKDDTRFDRDSSKVNAADVTISVMDGEVSQKVADAKFPNAKKLAAPSGSDTTIIAMNVVTKKADVLITNLMLGTEFIKRILIL